MNDKCEAVVIGTGFGGAINACRLARKWPGKVVVLERGKRYGLGEFPRAPGDFARNFWVLRDRTPHPGHVRRAAGKTSLPPPMTPAVAFSRPSCSKPSLGGRVEIHNWWTSTYSLGITSAAR